MTSSLVGSEMCIRDRCTGWGARRATARATVGGPCRQRGYKIMEHLPVSYTHLTLPTICSV
eukprot:12731671-Prorocentrum_lima.AAC.1